MSRLDELMALADEYACAMVACAVSDTPAEHVKSKCVALERALRDALEPQGWKAPALSDLFSEMRKIDPNWNAFGRSRSEAVALALRVLAAAPKEPTK